MVRRELEVNSLLKRKILNYEEGVNLSLRWTFIDEIWNFNLIRTCNTRINFQSTLYGSQIKVIYTSIYIDKNYCITVQCTNLFIMLGLLQ